jgi:hypothetical protein
LLFTISAIFGITGIRRVVQTAKMYINADSRIINVFKTILFEPKVIMDINKIFKMKSISYKKILFFISADCDVKS